MTWQERPEDNNSSNKTLGARKREWGEVAVSTPHLETVYSSPMASNWASTTAQHRGRRGPGRSSTPRGREAPLWGGAVTNGGGRNGRGAPGSSGARKGHSVGGWRRASADFGQSALAATVSNAQVAEDSLGYPLLPCDGRECKIRIVERLGEISGSRAAPGGGGGGSSGGSETQLDSSVSSAGNNAGSGTASGELHGGWGSGGNGCGGGHSDLVQRGLLGREGFVCNGSMSGIMGVDLDDTALNELGDTELEIVLERMWMKVMGQVRAGSGG